MRVGSVKVAAMALGMLVPLAKTAAQEGKEVIEAMLVVGLIFASVIALGQLSRWFRHRRH
jgi:hypothetical protein